MTTICFKDGVLAADTRSTSRTHRMCLNCGNTRNGTDDTKKVHEYTTITVKFKDERVVAMACTGPSWWCNAMYKAMAAGQDVITLCDFMRDAMKMDEVTNMIGSAIIVTENHVWHYDATKYIDHEMLKSWPRNTQQVVVDGTGADYAYMTAMEGGDAIAAVRNAGKYDQHTSQIVDSVNCNQMAVGLGIHRDRFTADKKHYRS
jgi:hypothetical protein